MNLLVVATVCAVASVAAYLFVFEFVPARQDLSRVTKPAAREQARHDARTAAVQFLGALGLAIGAVFTARTFALNRQGQITERFTNAIAQLGDSGSQALRLGGIYALERIARESRQDHGPVVEVLCAFVRHHARWRPQGSDHDNPWPGHIPGDVQAAMAVLGRRRLEHDGDVRLHLQHVDLRRAQLDGARLEARGLTYRVDLSGAHLEGASLVGASLEGARIERAHLEGAQLISAHLGADFSHAHVQGALFSGKGAAVLSDANAQGTSFAQLDMSGALLWDAALQGAAFDDVILRGAKLAGADLAGAVLARVDLRGADLTSANLRGAWLTEVDLTGADLTGADLRGVTAEGTTWPAGWDPARLGDDWPAAAAMEAGRLPEDGDCRGVRLIHVHTGAIDFRGGDLRGAHLTVRETPGADLREADLRGARLTGSFPRARFDGADLRGARFLTSWPDGLDPARAGVLVA